MNNMKPRPRAPRPALAVLLFLAALAGLSAHAQQQPPPQGKTDDVVRISTELVQTGVTVVDKQGRFVDGLKADQFVLKVDGQPVTPSFFERVTAGTAREEKQVEAALAAAKPAAAAGATYRGRTIIFFIDDLHLSLDGIGRTRATLKHFIDEQMTPSDQVAFVSATGQMGFLQQLTDNKSVLRAALGRLKPIPMNTRDTDQPPMTEFTAVRIMNGDRDAADFYIDKIIEGFATKKLSTRAMNRNAVNEMVKTRANNIVFGVEAVTEATLASLDSWVQNISPVPGRKLVFFISEGFYLDSRKAIGAANAQLQRVTDTATRTGSVIYTIDARGLFAPIADATGDRPTDPKGRLDRSNVGEATLSQEGLNALAGDTGGRFLRNQNYFDDWVARMLDETSNYYLLAWRPPTEEQKGAKFKRMEISIPGRPDLTVRLPKGFLAGRPAADAEKAAKDKTPAPNTNAPAAAAKGPEVELKSAMLAAAPVKGLPTQLSLGFVDVPGTGPVLTASMQVATDVLGYGDDGKQQAAVDMAGVVLNEQGKPAGSFKTRLTVNPLSEKVTVEHPGVIYTNKVPLKPGLYQVRVAARDDKSGRVGSASRWIEIPDLAAKRLTLSNLMLNGQLVGSKEKEGGEQVQFSVDHRFKKGSHLNFLTIVYNAAGAPPDLEAQIKISRDGQSIVNTPARKIGTPQGTDLARVPYGADIALNNLPAGRYVLQVTVNDRAAKTSATQQTTFDIE